MNKENFNKSLIPILEYHLGQCDALNEINEFTEAFTSQEVLDYIDENMQENLTVFETIASPYVNTSCDEINPDYETACLLYEGKTCYLGYSNEAIEIDSKHKLVRCGAYKTYATDKGEIIVIYEIATSLYNDSAEHCEQVINVCRTLIPKENAIEYISMDNISELIDGEAFGEHYIWEF